MLQAWHRTVACEICRPLIPPASRALLQCTCGRKNAHLGAPTGQQQNIATMERQMPELHWGEQRRQGMCEMITQIQEETRTSTRFCSLTDTTAGIDTLLQDNAWACCWNLTHITSVALDPHRFPAVLSPAEAAAKDPHPHISDRFHPCSHFATFSSQLPVWAVVLPFGAYFVLSAAGPASSCKLRYSLMSRDSQALAGTYV
jgi:hypothetical protein